jgi:hypothetical protein
MRCPLRSANPSKKGVVRPTVVGTGNNNASARCPAWSSRSAFANALRRVEYRLVRELARAGPRIEIERYPRMEMARDTLQQITWAIGIQSGLGRVDPLSQRCVDAGHLGIGIELADAPRRRCGLGMGRPGRLGLDRAAQPLLAYAIGQNRTGVFGTRLIARVDRLVRFVRFGERAGIGHSG